MDFFSPINKFYFFLEVISPIMKLNIPFSSADFLFYDNSVPENETDSHLRMLTEIQVTIKLRKKSQILREFTQERSIKITLPTRFSSCINAQELDCYQNQVLPASHQECESNSQDEDRHGKTLCPATVIKTKYIDQMNIKFVGNGE